MATPIYHRLTHTRTAPGFTAVSIRSSLWLGSDHLLLVDQTGYRETYKRFYFRDIQAITVQITNRRVIWNAILTIPLVVCLIGMALSIPPAQKMNLIALSVWSFFAALFSIPMIINNFRGTACLCQIRTAVQTEELYSLSRVRQTQKALARLRPLIIAAQGQLTGEEVSLRMREAAGLSIPPQPAPPQSAPPAVS